jgi:hypothetical protein
MNTISKATIQRAAICGAHENKCADKISRVLDRVTFDVIRIHADQKFSKSDDTANNSPFT